MKRLYAPWRGKYIADTAHKKDREKPAHECVFCQQLQENQDEKHFILRRFNHTFVMLNLYPYAGGHLLLLPYAHVTDLYELESHVLDELMAVTSASTRVVKEVLDAKGVNVGINLGIAAGAGIPSHLHMHVLPRWPSDTNFLPLIGNVKPISIDLPQVYQRLKVAFAQL